MLPGRCAKKLTRAALSQNELCDFSALILNMKLLPYLLSILISVLNATSLYAQAASSPIESSASVTPAAGAKPVSETSASGTTAIDQGGISAGTTITSQNWQTYRAFMPEGMISLFEGQYFWKMPADVQMEVGPTIVLPLPRAYAEATDKYAPLVSIVELLSGGLNLQGYRGGVPFPNPEEPHKGWKVLADSWYGYVPHLIVDTYGTFCEQDRAEDISCSADLFVGRQLSFNTDPGIPSTIPGSEDKAYSSWFMTLEPENRRYTTSLVISYTDLNKPRDFYAFFPDLRRSQALATHARCSQYSGGDLFYNLTQLKADFIGEKKLLALVDVERPTDAFPAGYSMPLGWPKPSWGKWQLRDAYVISVSKIPSEAAPYCYGKRVMYVDKASSAVLWFDLYDRDMKYWRFGGDLLKTIDAPGIGRVTSNAAATELIWDIQNSHATYYGPGLNRPFYVNEQAPKEYNDLPRYTTSSGLSEIMR
jgi:hypothetical protein